MEDSPSETTLRNIS